MLQTWRWFGPGDKVTVSDARQAGAEAIVTALHHIPPGTVWSIDQIEQRKSEVASEQDGEPTTMFWAVAESLPVSEDIKTQSGNWNVHLQNYRTSIENLAAAGIGVICYNFMPVLDWTRTDLAASVVHGGRAMRFDVVDLAAFDMFVLRRANAHADYPANVVESAGKRASVMSDGDKNRLGANIMAGLPGAAESWSLQTLHEGLDRYAELSPDRLRRNHIDFLSEVVPTAERLGVRLCCHPDDPPFPLLGLPRIMSTEEDYRALLDAADSPACGVTLCTGSLGARPDNDLVRIASNFAARVHFVHLRNVARDTETIPCSFTEVEHLEGQVDMVGVVETLMREEASRREAGRSDAVIPMRPDHGQDILDDLQRGAQPGYPAIGRLKGLAELRGVMAALKYKLEQAV